MKIDANRQIPTIAALDLPRHGVTHINVSCDRCHHQAAVPLTASDGCLTIIEYGARLRCTACGVKGCSAIPAWPAGRDPGRAHSHSR